MTHYQPRHFDLRELVDRPTYEALWEKAWWLFRPELLAVADAIRDHFGVPVFVNNWDSGGELQYRGFRPRDCTVGAPYSQHRLGCALDFSVYGVRDAVVRNELVRLHHLGQEPFGWITGIEADTVGWVHIDLRNYNGLLIFRG